MVEHNRHIGRHVPFTIAGVLLGGVMAAISVLGTSSAAFQGTTKNETDSWAAGTVTLTDDDSQSAMFTVTNMVPGDAAERCIEVEYTGSSSDITPIKLYTTIGTNVDNFADYINLTVEQGSGATFGNCSQFVASPTTPLIDSQPLSTVASSHSNFATGVGSFKPTSGSTKVSFRFSVELDTATPNTSQGDSAGATFTWEIQSA